MIMYGLGTCAVCKKALKALEADGKTVNFRDVRADPLTEDELAALDAEFGGRLVDQTSNDYRGLNEWLKNSEADAQVRAQPKVMARPIIQSGDIYYLGWDDAVQAALISG